MLDDTSDWNPLIFALVFNKTALLQHLLLTALNLEELIAISLPRRDYNNHKMHTKEQLLEGQLTTLLLLVENKSPNLKILLDRYHDCFDKKLFHTLMPLVARTKHADEHLPIIMKSHAFKGLFYEEVKTPGLAH